MTNENNDVDVDVVDDVVVVADDDEDADVI